MPGIHAESITLSTNLYPPGMYKTCKHTQIMFRLNKNKHNNGQLQCFSCLPVFKYLNPSSYKPLTYQSTGLKPPCAGFERLSIQKGIKTALWIPGDPDINGLKAVHDCTNFHWGSFFSVQKTWSHQNKLRHGEITGEILLPVPSFRPIIATSELIISGCLCI